MEIEHNRDLRLLRERGVVREVLHVAQPFTDSSVDSPTELARLYLQVHASVFNIDPASSFEPAGSSSPLTGVTLTSTPAVVMVRESESVAVSFAQVQRIPVDPTASVEIPVWGAGIRVMIALTPLRVTAASSTLQPGLPAFRIARPLPLDRRRAADLVGIPYDDVHGLFIHEPAGRAEEGTARGLALTLVYGRQDDPGSGSVTEGRTVVYREYADLAALRVVRRDVLASHAAGLTGLVFPVDPCSQTSRPGPAPFQGADALDPFRAPRELHDLVAPTAGAPQELRGPRVLVAPDNPLKVPPPTVPPERDFDFTSRCNHFAAVSAYRHSDATLRMLESVGFPLAQSFAANVQAGRWPLRVVHRAPIRPGPAVFDGRTVNAQVVGDTVLNVVREVRFALADLSDTVTAPLGIAADARFAWHEFCHALLIAATGSPEFPFAHSAGDALAAIICDLDSDISQDAPAWRGVTFPWVEALRRHDRRVEDGWGWHGSLYSEVRDIRDPGGYRGEQILSSTLFRLYRALGGDATLGGNVPDLPVRRAAAAYAVYLVVAAITALGPVAVTPAATAYVLAYALVQADLATRSLMPDRHLFAPFRARARRGAAVHKVVRWAFECQGLHAPGSGPRIWNARGEPDAVDVYIDDGRHGEYDYTPRWDANPSILVNARPVANAQEAAPQRGTTSYVFVRVQSRGTDPRPDATRVRVFAARARLTPPRWRLAAGPRNPWRELTPGAGATTTAVVPPGVSVDFGPFEWLPSAAGPHGLLACADVPGDRCNALVPTYACAIGPTRLEHLVPFDNNIGYRRVVI